MRSSYYWGLASDPAGTQESRALGNSMSEPLPGLYDNDGKADLVVWDPEGHRFLMRLSGDAWGSVLTRVFPSSLQGKTQGLYTWDRSAGVPVRGMTRHRWVCQGFLCLYRPRLALAVWFDWNGKWYINWSPDTSAASPLECQWGLPGDVPIGGIGSIWDNSAVAQPLSQMAVYRSTSNSGPGTLYFKSSSLADCGGSILPSAAHNGQPRTLVYGVRDMTGDKLPEIWFVDTDHGQGTYFTSGDGYQTGVWIPVGDQRAVLL